MEGYNGSTEIISGLTPKNDIDIPLIHAHHVQVDVNGTRLDEALSNAGSSFENEETLKKFTEDGSGNPLYNGNEIGSKVTIDNELSDESENPVQNKIIKAEFDNCMKKDMALRFQILSEQPESPTVGDCWFVSE